MYHVGRPGDDSYVERVLQRVGRRRPQQPHQHLLVGGAVGYADVDGLRPPVGRLRQRQGDLPHLLAPRGRPLLQPPRPADHRGQAVGREGDLRRPAAVQHGVDGRPLAAGVAGHRAGAAARHRPAAARARHVGPRVRAPLGQLGDVPRRAVHPDRPCDVRASSGRRCSTTTPSYTPRARRAPVRRRRRRDPRDRRRSSAPTSAGSRRTPGAPPAPATSAAGRRRAACSSSTCSPVRSATEGGTSRNGWNKFIPEPPKAHRPARPVERAHLAARVPARPPRDAHAAAALPQGGPGPARHLLHPRLQPGVDQPRRVHVAGGADRRPSSSAATSRSRRRGRRRRGSPTTCCRWASAPSATTSPATRPTPGAGSGSANRCCAAYAELGAARSVRQRTHETNPGEVWEENEFWIDLSWRIDPDGALGIRQHASRATTGRASRSPSTSTTPRSSPTPSPACPRRPPRPGMTPLEYMRDHGAFAIPGDQYTPYERPVDPAAIAGCTRDDAGVYRKPGTTGMFDDELAEFAGHMPFIGDGSPASTSTASRSRASRHRRASSSCSRRRCATGAGRSTPRPGWIPSATSTGRTSTSPATSASCCPTFRHPDADPHPVRQQQVAQRDQPPPPAVDPPVRRRAARHRRTAGSARITTRIGHFVIQTWRTEGIRPGVVAASHHMGRWRLDERAGAGRWSAGRGRRSTSDGTAWRLRRERRASSRTTSADPDTGRIWWTDTGVHQNLTFRVQPDPVSGMHCWLPAGHASLPPPTATATATSSSTPPKSTRGVPRVAGHDPARARPPGLRRPLWFARPVKPTIDAYRL